MGRNGIKYLALALALGAGLGAGSAQAQAILEVGGAGAIGVTTLTTAKVPAGANWTTAGQDADAGPTNYSNLTSPTVKVLNSGAVKLKFKHRYNFQDTGFDGGAILISKNGGTPAYVPKAAFTSTGYTGNSNSNPVVFGADGKECFSDISPDWASGAQIEETVNIPGTYNPDDTIAVTFAGGWDWSWTNGVSSCWEISKVELTDAGPATLLAVDFSPDGASGFTVTNAPATIQGPWQYPKPISRFEINADTLTADRYAPTTPGTNINLNGANISVVLLTGTLDAGDTFTLFNLTGGTTLSGTPGIITLPPGTWNTANLAVNGTIVCVLPKPPFVAPTPPPVTDGMKVWLSGDGVNTDDLAQVRVAGSDTFVTQWKDFSSNGKHATNATVTDQPKYIASGLNGKPVLRFAQDNDDNGDRLYLGDLSADFPTAGSVFVVSTIDNDARYNLFGNRDAANDERWVANTWGESRPGSFRQSRSQSANFTQSDWPTTGSHVFALESSSSVFQVLIDGASIGTDTPAYNSGNGQNWTIGNRATNGQQLRGDIAELILFNRILTPLEANKVGGYLMQKYGLTTAYPPLNLTAKLTSPANAQAYPFGSTIEASATVAAGSVSGGMPPYTVQFWVDDALAGTATTEDPYTLNLNPLTNGPHQIYAKVTDSTTPTPLTAISATHAFTVSPAAATTTTLASSANPSTYGAATVTATVVASDSSMLTGGTVQFYDGFEFLGNPVAVNTVTGMASHSINTLGVGPHAITAEYSGHGVYSASSAPALAQVVDVARLTVTANNVFRPTGTANLDPLPYKITGYQNGENRSTSGVFGDPLLTTAAVTASPAGNYAITCFLGSLEATNYSFTLVDGTLTVAEVANTFSVNFYVGPDWPYGGLGTATDEQKDNVKVAPGMPAGFGDWFTNGWLNYLVPWAPTAPQAPVTLTSNRGSTATFKFNDCRNGWTYSGAPRTTLVGDGNGNMMDGHVNSTLDPLVGGLSDGSNWFKMEMSAIPFAVYDVIFYMGANQAQFVDGKGAIVFNGGAERDFTLKSGAFDGTFTEMVDATTPGNYIVFKGVTGSTFTTQTYGKGPTGFNHIGPFGFQIRAATANYGTWAVSKGIPGEPASGDYDKDGLSNLVEYALGKDPKVPDQPAGVLSGNTITFPKGADAIANGDVSWAIETSTDLGVIDDWTTVESQPAGTTNPTIFHTFTPSTPVKDFARLKVTQLP